MNESETNKMTSREAWKLNMRCFRLWWDRRPSWLLSIVTHSILQVVTPYVGICFSAQVMNELAGNRDPQELMRLVLLTLCSAAVLAVLTTVSSRWQEGELTIANQMLDKIYADKELQMDFCSMDSQEVQDTKNQIEQTQNYGGYGIFKPVYQDAPKLISALTGIIGAIVLTVSLFTQKIPESGGALTVLNHPIFIVVPAAVMLVVTILAPVLATKADQPEAEKVSEGRAGNRWFSYYGFRIYNKAFALDMRLYNRPEAV